MVRACTPMLKLQKPSHLSAIVGWRHWTGPLGRSPPVPCAVTSVGTTRRWWPRPGRARWRPSCRRWAATACRRAAWAAAAGSLPRGRPGSTSCGQGRVEGGAPVRSRRRSRAPSAHSCSNASPRRDAPPLGAARRPRTAPEAERDAIELVQVVLLAHGEGPLAQAAVVDAQRHDRGAKRQLPPHKRHVVRLAPLGAGEVGQHAACGRAEGAGPLRGVPGPAADGWVATVLPRERREAPGPRHKSNAWQRPAGASAVPAPPPLHCWACL